MFTCIEDRVLTLAEFAIKTNSTMRVLAKNFGISKSTAYVDMTVRLPKLNSIKAKEVYLILMKNKAERTSRGGYAKYKKSILFN